MKKSFPKDSWCLSAESSECLAEGKINQRPFSRFCDKTLRVACSIVITEYAPSQKDLESLLGEKRAEALSKRPKKILIKLQSFDRAPTQD